MHPTVDGQVAAITRTSMWRLKRSRPQRGLCRGSCDRSEQKVATVHTVFPRVRPARVRCARVWAARASTPLAITLPQTSALV